MGQQYTNDDPDSTGELLIEGQGLTRVLGQTYDLAPDQTPTEEFLPLDNADSPAWFQAHHTSAGQAPGGQFEGLSMLALHTTFSAVRTRLIQADFDDFTLESLIQGIGLEPSEADALRNNFKDATQLTVELLLQHWYSALFADLSQAAVDGTSVADRIALLGLRHMERARQDPELGLAVTSLQTRPDLRAQTPRELLAQLDAFNARILKTLAGLIAEGQMLHEIREGDPVALALVTLAAYYGFLNLLSTPQRLAQRGVYLDELARQVVEVTVAGLKT